MKYILFCNNLVSMLYLYKRLNYERLNLIIIYPWNFAHLKKNHEKKSSLLKFSIFFQVVKFISNVLKTFVDTLWYYNEKKFDLLKL